MDEIFDLFKIIFVFASVILLVVGGVFFFQFGPNWSNYWQLDYQKAQIELQMKSKCLSDKYYCNPQNYNFELKGKEPQQ